MPYLHEFFGLAALLIGLSGYIIYIRSILRGDTRPHIFTHLVWSTITLIAFAAQVYDNAGPGAWVIGLSAFFCLLQVALAFKYGDRADITCSDKIALAASLSAIIPWLLTNDPLWSVILISIIDGVAFYPTMRKSWRKPWDENLTAYNMASLKFALSLVAMRNFTIVTTLYAFAVIALNSSFTLMCLIRRQSFLGEHEFVGYVDSDDYVFPGVMRACLDGLKAHRGVVTMERQLWGSLLSARRYEGHHLTIYRREDVLPLLSVLPEHPYLCDRYVAGMLPPTQLPVDGYVWRRHVGQGHRNADEAQARNLKEALSCG